MGVNRKRFARAVFKSGNAQEAVPGKMPEAASCCTSRSSAYNCIVMGAIMMASIIIFRQITIIAISILVLVLLAILSCVTPTRCDC